MYFTRSFVYKLYNHIELFVLMLVSMADGGSQIGIFTLFGSEYFNYCIVTGVAMIAARQKILVSKCLFLRDFVFCIIVYYCFYSYVLSDGTMLWVIATWGSYLLFLIVDTNNECLLTLLFKLLCLISEDESFDATPLEIRERRRYRSEMFVDFIDEVKQSKDFKDAVSKQNYVYSMNYKNDKKKIEAYKKWARGTYVIIFCIRKTTDQARMLRDEDFMTRAGVLENIEGSAPVSSVGEKEDDEISGFLLKKKRQQGSGNSGEFELFIKSKLLFFD